MKFQKSSSVRGAWAKGAELTHIKRGEITSEAELVPSQYTNKDGSVRNQTVCKIGFEGVKDELNINLNLPTRDALIDAFGEDSADWIGQPLAVETEKVKVAGKSVYPIYLIPEGYEKVDDEDGYTHIIKKEGVQGASKERGVDTSAPTEEDVVQADGGEDADPDKVPF